MMSRREAFAAECDAAYARRRGASWAALKAGDRITADVAGARVVCVVVRWESPDLVVDVDGREVVINRYQFGARRID